jgi:hypothetical protein
VLARRIHTDLTPDEVERVTEGVQEFHLTTTWKQPGGAGPARELMDAAEVELGEAASGADLQVAQELNARRRRAVNDAQKILGQALGEMEANAPLTVAMKQGKKDQFQVSLGKKSIEDAIRRCARLACSAATTRIETVAGDTLPDHQRRMAWTGSPSRSNARGHRAGPAQPGDHPRRP